MMLRTLLGALSCQQGTDIKVEKLKPKRNTFFVGFKTMTQFNVKLATTTS